ncbi:methyltransferase family protein [Halobacillus sp. SY10]|uniref:Protein-S-isoprenylcysteine O-methyltransferase Ste14 n=2 Tax=Halobacillus TaxID=45667 RepID=A0A1H0V3B9_HALAD|nr:MULTISPECIES: isoprenylcysteine carboxylmethyltransferase family protein [Halobacillus]RDY70704.1 isoprenylcysteine carboxylmethyltransferase family protein [Halobacillus trueperi]SDP72950.1 Protein-S-isoprenylcysteine O-methyltransferase Ste14 [Halobacillus aidingensis]
MTLFDGLFLVVTVFWLAEFFIFRNDRSGESGSYERRSFLLILAAVVVTLVFSLLMQEWDIGIIYYRGVWWIGLVVYAIGVGLRYWGILHLKDQFTRNVSVQEGDRLVSSGPYRLLRHPLYTGLLFIIIGFCSGLGNLYAALLCGIFMTIALLHRIKLEEAMLVEQHGERYRKWCRSRYRLIPFVY